MTTIAQTYADVCGRMLTYAVRRLANSASLSPPSTTYSKDHKRAGSPNGSRTARAKEAVARLYKQV
jgi:hypothetical protein